MSNVPSDIKQPPLTTVVPIESAYSGLSDRSRSAKGSPRLNRHRVGLNYCSPNDRLRLIQFLQELNLDKALQLLPDEFTFQDFVQVSYDVLRHTFENLLNETEINRLWKSLQRCKVEKASRSLDNRNCQYYGVPSVDQNIKSSLSGNLIVRCTDMLSDEDGVSENTKEHVSIDTHSSFPHTESTILSGTGVLFDKDDQTSGLQQTTSLDVIDRLSRLRPAPLSVTNPSPIRSASSTGRNRSGDRGYGIRLGGGGFWETTVSSAGASSMSHRSSLLLMPLTHHSPISYPPLTLSPSCLSHSGHSVGSNLLKMRRGAMGQSVPNLFSSCRDNLGFGNSTAANISTSGLYHGISGALPASASSNSSFHQMRLLRTPPRSRFLSDNEPSDPVTATVPLITPISSLALMDICHASPPPAVLPTRISPAHPIGPVSTTQQLTVTSKTPSPLNANIDASNLVKAMGEMRVVSGEESLTSNPQELRQHGSGFIINAYTSNDRPQKHHGSSAGVCKQCGNPVTEAATTRTPRILPLTIPAHLQLSETRRWSLPSSGYGTNTPISSTVSSQYSSKENIQGVQFPIHFRHPTPSAQPTITHTLAPFPSSSSSTFNCDSPSPKLAHFATSSDSPLSSPLTATAPQAQSGGAVPTSPEWSCYNSVDNQTPSAGTPIRRLPRPSMLCVKCSGGHKEMASFLPPSVVPFQYDSSVTPATAADVHGWEVTASHQHPRQNLNLPGFRQRSKSLSPARLPSNNEHDILLLNHVYRERFPKASAQMQDNLKHLFEEMEHKDTFSWSSVARFMHKQVLELARDCYEKALAGLITCRYFFELTERLKKLVHDTRAKCPEAVACVTNLCNRLLLVISRPARLLECLEFDPSEFYQMLEKAESHVRQQSDSNNIFCPDVPRYIISKLGLSRPADSVCLTNEYASDRIGDDPLVPLPALAMDMSASFEESVPSTPILESSPRVKCGVHSSPQVPRRRPCEADFEIIKLISNGAYGAVFLVRDRITRERFGMKKMQKQHLRLRNQVEQVFAERDILSFADNPFVVSLYCTFETKKSLCLVMEFVEGGDVATLLKNICGPLPDDLAQMYFAELVLALDYLHSYGIVHRDLKPDNLLITYLGHIKLTDFGLSRIGLMNMATTFYERSLDLEKDCKMFRDKQVFGTPEYIAPEVILRQGYGKPVDWWAAGIILYEFLVGIVPFCGETIEELFTQIVSGTIEWPSNDGSLSSEAISLITQLLERDPFFRLGTETGAAEVKEAAFFKGLDWCNLLRQKAAFVPQLDHEEDCSYFDPRSDRYQHDVEDDEDMDYDLGHIQTSAPFSSASSVVSGSSRPPSKERYFSDSSRRAQHEEGNGTLTSAMGRLTAEQLHSSASKADFPTEISDDETPSDILPDETLFHAFASCSPKFTIATERVALEAPLQMKDLDDLDVSTIEQQTLPGRDVLYSTSLSTTPTRKTSRLSPPPASPGSLPQLFPASSAQQIDFEPVPSSSSHKRPSGLRLHASSIKKIMLVKPTNVSPPARDHAGQSKPSLILPQPITTPTASDAEGNSESFPTLPSQPLSSYSAVPNNGSPKPLIHGHRKVTSPQCTLVTGTGIPPAITKTPTRRRGSLADTTTAKRTVLITRGPRGFGFTLRAKNVYFGSSDLYTLHHIIVWVDRNGPAFAAGLRENDLILRVNGRGVIGRLHTEVVQLICSSTSPLNLRVTPFSQSNIRSDGHWRARGRLVARMNRLTTRGLPHFRGPSEMGSKPSSGDESGLEGGAATARRFLRRLGGAKSLANSVKQTPPPAIERRHRHRQLAADKSCRQHGSGSSSSNSSLLHTSIKQADSTTLPNKMPLQPRRSKETPLFRQLSERNRCMAQSVALENVSGRMSGSWSSSSSPTGAVGNEVAIHSRGPSPLVLRPFLLVSESDGGVSTKPTICVAPPATVSPKISSNFLKASSSTTSAKSPSPVSDFNPSERPMAVRLRHRRRHSSSSSSQNRISVSPSPCGTRSPSHGPTNM